MCGIVAYIGDQPVAPLLLEGLKRLEYRGYDSAGIAVVKSGAMKVIRSLGRVSVLESLVDAQQEEDDSLKGHLGISHTRWATHGSPTKPMLTRT